MPGDGQGTKRSLENPGNVGEDKKARSEEIGMLLENVEGWVFHADANLRKKR